MGLERSFDDNSIRRRTVVDATVVGADQTFFVLRDVAEGVEEA